MTILQRLLTIVLLVEFSAAAFFVGRRMTQPVPPTVDLGGLDADAQALMSSLHSQATFGSTDSWSRLADACLGNGFFPQAEACYREVLHHNPDEITSIYGLALSLSRSGRTSEAIDQFRRFIDIAGPHHADAAWYPIGRCFLRQENADEAESAFRQARQMPEGELQLAKLLIQTGREAEALSIIERLLERYPRSLRVLELAMVCARQQGREPDSRNYADRLETASYQFVMSLDVSDVDNYRTRAGFAPSFAAPPSTHERTALSSNLDRLTDQIDRNPAWLHRRLLLPAAQAALEHGKPQMAVRTLDDLFECGQVTPEALVVYGDAHLAMQQPEEAVRAWQRSLTLRPNAQAHRRLADAEASLSDEERRDHRAMASHLNGLSEYRAGRAAEAYGELSSAVALKPDHARSWLYLGKSLHELGRPHEAAEAFETCLKFDPHNGEAIAALAEIPDRNP